MYNIGKIKLLKTFIFIYNIINEYKHKILNNYLLKQK